MPPSYLASPFAALLAVVFVAACGSGSSTPPEEEANQSAASSGAQAEDPASLPDWFPEDIYLPDDFRQQSSSKIGTRTFLLDGRTDETLETLQKVYPEKLEAEGYTVRRPDREEEASRSIYFSRQGGLQANILLLELGNERSIRVDFSGEM